MSKVINLAIGRFGDLAIWGFDVLWQGKFTVYFLTVGIFILIS
jgi:hypothetical protein